MNEQQYLDERVDDQIDWYSGKAAFNQRRFRRLQLVSIVAAAAIPFLTGYVSGDWGLMFQVLVGALGVLVAVITGVLGLMKYQENWIAYRATAEALKSEKYRFLAGAPPYDGASPFKTLVVRCETLLREENAGWVDHMTDEGEDESPDEGDQEPN